MTTAFHEATGLAVSARTRRWTLPLLAVCVLLLAVLPRAQADPKADFVQALARFSLGLDGAFGDEGAAARANLDALDRGLQQWDASIRTYEAAMRSELPGADTALAARMHAALGSVYLDRSRIEDAMRELGAAAAINPASAELQTVQGLVYSRLLNDPASATRMFRQAWAIEPANPVRAYLLARHLSGTGYRDEAVKALRVVQASGVERADGRAPAAPFMTLGLVPETTGVEPFFPPALYAEGFALLRRGDYAAAIAQLRTAVAADPLAAAPGPDAEALAQGTAAFRDGAVASAIEHIEKAIAIAPAHAEAHRILGMVLAADKQYARSAEVLGTAVRLNPRDERARLARADTFMKDNQLPAAERLLKETIEILPASGRARYMLGRLYERQGTYAEAVRALEEAATFGPLLGLNGIYQTIGNMDVAQQDFDAALAAYGRRVDVHPNDAGAHQALGGVYARLGRSDEALAEFAIASLLNPDDAEAYVSMAQVRLADGQYEPAIDAARRALAIDAVRKEAQYALATSLVRLGRTEEGARELEVFQRLQAADSAEKSRQFQLGALRREAAASAARQDYEGAAAQLARAVQLDPDSAAARVDLGLALVKARKPLDAIEHFSRAAVLDADYEVYRHLADAYAAAGQPDASRRARAVYEQMRQQALRRAGSAR